MSYWVYLKIDTGNTESLTTVVEVGNLTRNLSQMHSLAGCWIRDFENKSALDSIPILEKGIADMKANPDKYKALNPSNGWGDYEWGLEFLERLLNACKEHPKCTIEVSG